MLWLFLFLPCDEWSIYGEHAGDQWSLFAKAEVENETGDSGVDLSRWGIVKFTASWCGPCRTQDRELGRLPDDIQIRRIDVDANKSAARSAGVGSIPDTRLIWKNDAGQWVQVFDGQSRQKWVGVVTASRILSEIEKRSDSEGAKRDSEQSSGDADVAGAVTAGTDPANVPKTINQRWSVNGNWNASRSYLIRHLMGSNHGYNREDLEAMTHDELIRLHDDDHEKKRRPIRRTYTRRRG